MILAEQEPARHNATLARLIEKGGTQSAAVFGRNGKVLH